MPEHPKSIAIINDTRISRPSHNALTDWKSSSQDPAFHTAPPSATGSLSMASESAGFSVENLDIFTTDNMPQGTAQHPGTKPLADPAYAHVIPSLFQYFIFQYNLVADLYKTLSPDIIRALLTSSGLSANLQYLFSQLVLPEGPALLPAACKQLVALADQASGRPTPQPTEKVDIIVPVYGGAEETRRCLSSLLASRVQHPHEILVINDASPDPEQVAWLRSLADRGAITLLCNPTNLGFVATVNRGMALHPDRDVVLLNSDTEVASDWLDRLIRAAYASCNIGTVTPFSNNATLCSYPRAFFDNALPAGASTAKLDALCAKTVPGAHVDLPTAVGFCMYIRRACLAETGLFSVEHFGKGYGEENDFCMRATRRGWRHILCADTFVFHSGGASFSDSSNPRKQAAQATLERLHPDYAARVHRHIERDPARPLRAAVESRRLQVDPRPTILAITHGLGGGTDKHVDELAERFGLQANFLILAPRSDEHIEVRWAARDAELRLYFRAEADHSALLTWLRSLGIARVHLHHTKSLPASLWRLPHDLGVPFDFTAHDFFSLCPQISLTTKTGQYCGEPDEAGCNRCLATTPTPHPGRLDIATWRREYQALLSQAERIFCPSHDCAHRILRLFAGVSAPPVVIAPHPDLDGVTLPSPAPPALVNRPLRVAVLGQLTRIKGADVLDAVAQRAHALDAPLEFHLIGEPYRLLKQAPKSRLRVHGRYADADLPRLLQQLAPDLIWFPAQAPETYSYTLSACLKAGLPVVAPNLGAFPERLAGRAWSFIERWDRSPQDWCDFFVALRRQHFAPNAPPPPPTVVPQPTVSAFAYARDYLAPIAAKRTPPSPLPAVEPAFFFRHALPPRLPLGPQRLKQEAVRQVNNLKSIRLFRQLIETIPQSLRTRAYRFLAGSRA